MNVYRCDIHIRSVNVKFFCLITIHIGIQCEVQKCCVSVTLRIEYCAFCSCRAVVVGLMIWVIMFYDTHSHWNSTQEFETAH